MPGISKETAPTVEDFGPVANRQGDCLGYTIQFLHFRAVMDGAAMLRCPTTCASAPTGATF